VNTEPNFPERVLGILASLFVGVYALSLDPSMDPLRVGLTSLLWIATGTTGAVYIFAVCTTRREMFATIAVVATIFSIGLIAFHWQKIAPYVGYAAMWR
jgi:hypothetical protein